MSHAAHRARAASGTPQSTAPPPGAALRRQAALPLPPVVPPITQFLQGKIASRRVRWLAYRRFVTLTTLGMFVGMMVAAPWPSAGRDDFLSEGKRRAEDAYEKWLLADVRASNTAADKQKQK